MYTVSFTYVCMVKFLKSQKFIELIEYRIVGKFGGGKVWRIDSFRAFGERKFGELIDQTIHY